MKNKFNQTETNKIPEDWRVMKLGDIITSFHNGIWGDVPLPNFISYPVIKSTEITSDGKIDLSTVAYRKIPEDKVKKFTLDEGDILLVASSGSPDLIGRAALFRQPDDDRVYLFSNFMLRIRPQTIEKTFLFYLLSSQHYYRFLKSIQQTSTGLRNLPKKNLLNFTIPYPSLHEQQKIAEVLGTVDEAIEKVDKAIKRTQRLKKGLMQELLTKGIRHKEFRDSEIGKIPKEWEVVKLNEIADVKGGKRIPKEDNIVDYPTPHPYIRVTDFKNGSVDIENIKYLLPKTFEKIKKYTISSEDVYISIAGTIGLSGLIPSQLDGANLTENAAKLSNLRKIKKEFLSCIINSQILQRQIKSYIGKATQPKLALFRIEKLNIPIPDINEQKMITEILNTMDKRLKLLRILKEKFERIKKGLMNDLLTGKKRVRV